MPAIPLQQAPHRQRGGALIFGLILLAVLTVTGIAGARDSVLQELMAAANRDRNTAFQAAESALRDAEAQIARLRFGCSHEDVVPPSGGSHQVALEGGGFLQVWDEDAADLPDPWSTASWNSATPYGGSLGGVPEQPRYTVEVVDVDDADGSVQFRITAAGRGSREAISVVQSRVQRSFERVIRIRGQDAANVVAIGDGLLLAEAALGTHPNIDISLGGWDPDGCNDDGAPVTLVYEGSGGADVFVVADLLGLGFAPGVSNLLDITSQLTGLDRALSDYRIERIFVENEGGTTAVAISTLNASGRFMEDNHYCINTAMDDTGSSLLDVVVKDVLGGLLPATPLDTILDGVVGAGNALVGSGGLLPVLPATASIIADGGGNDTYEIYTDTTAAAVVIADLGGNDLYRIRATGDGFVHLPVILALGGSNHFDIEGGTYVTASLNSGALTTLSGLLDSSSISSLLNYLSDVINLLFGGSCGGGLIGGVLCSILNPLANLLDGILDTVGDLLDPQHHPQDHAPVDARAGICTPEPMQRLSWREVFR